MQKKDELALKSGVWCGLNKPGMKEDDADVVVFGIPFDGGVSFRGGAAEAPRKLRENTFSSTPCTERLAFYDKLNIVDGGDFIGPDREEFFNEIKEYVKNLVSMGKKFTMVGGDHSVTIPCLWGVNEAIDEDLE
jgi:arginase family enzyme